jgi:predicted membrane protein
MAWCWYNATESKPRNVSSNTLSKREKEKLMKKISTEIIIIYILWISIFLSIYLKYKFDIFLIFGIIGLSIVTLTNKKKSEISLITLILILFLATFNLIKFSLAFGINLGKISLTNFILLIVLIYKRRNEVLDLKEKWFSENEEEIESQKIRKIEFFKNKFKNLSEVELNRKLSEENLTEEAKNAAIELINLKNISGK